jgi:hypothetical protein
VGTIGHQIATLHNLVRFHVVQVGEDRIERRKVAVNIRHDRKLHPDLSVGTKPGSRRVVRDASASRPAERAISYRPLPASSAP